MFVLFVFYFVIGDLNEAIVWQNILIHGLKTANSGTELFVNMVLARHNLNELGPAGFFAKRVNWRVTAPVFCLNSHTNDIQREA